MRLLPDSLSQGLVWVCLFLGGSFLGLIWNNTHVYPLDSQCGISCWAIGTQDE